MPCRRATLRQHERPCRVIRKIKSMFNVKRFGMHVASHRRGLGLSLRDAAKILGISAATLSRVERAEKPDIDTFVKICQWAEWSKKCDFFFVTNPVDLDDF